MFLAFGILMQFGGMLGQYAIAVQEPLFNWRYLHKTVQVRNFSQFFQKILKFFLQSIAFIIAIAGLFAAAIMQTNGDHLGSVHACLGLALIIVAFAQPFLALM